MISSLTSASALKLKKKKLAERVPARAQSKADNVAPRLERFTAMKRAKRDQIGQVPCLGFVRWRT